MAMDTASGARVLDASMVDKAQAPARDGRRTLAAPPPPRKPSAPPGPGRAAVRTMWRGGHRPRGPGARVASATRKAVLLRRSSR
jgi:hypothetical protein